MESTKSISSIAYSLFFISLNTLFYTFFVLENTGNDDGDGGGRGGGDEDGDDESGRGDGIKPYAGGILCTKGLGSSSPECEVSMLVIAPTVPPNIRGNIPSSTKIIIIKYI